VSTFSTVLNGQLVPVAPSNAVYVPPAPAPLISQGSAPSTLPGAVAGAAVNTGMPPTASVLAGGSTNMGPATPTPPAATTRGFVGNVWALPAWDNPIVLVLFFLILGYVILRAVHWSG
jgi:hypothetical protein